MNRREFSKTAAVGALGVGAGAAGATAFGAAPAMLRTPRAAESEQKQWAREHLQGLGSLLAASYTPDFKGLDEEGVRHDVRHRVKQGFCSTMLWSTGPYRDRILQIFKEESKGKLLRSQIVGGSADAAIKALDTAAKEGMTHAMVTFPGNLQPKTEDEVYAHFRKVLDSTKLPILLYGTAVASLRKFHPSGIPINVFDRLADHPNIVGMKMTHAMPVGLAFELSERLSNRMLMGPVNMDLAPMLAKNYPNIQWSSQWISDSLQSPERPYGNELFSLTRQRRITDAMKVYWQMQPLIDLVYEVQGRLLKFGKGHPAQHMKYYQWLMGGNGGLLPAGREGGEEGGDGAHVLTREWRKRMRETVEKVGIKVDRPDEEFMVGRAAYARGVRAKDLSSTPNYEV
jgi:4-hydroxy-tetrahydrodipicolinate synthase